jgi:hypothetical protein
MFFKARLAYNALAMILRQADAGRAGGNLRPNYNIHITRKSRPAYLPAALITWVLPVIIIC